MCCAAAACGTTSNNVGFVWEGDLQLRFVMDVLGTDAGSASDSFCDLVRAKTFV